MKKRLFTLILCLSLVSCIVPDKLIHQNVITSTAEQSSSLVAASQVDALLKGKCEKVWENPTGPWVSNFLRNTYDDTGCKFSSFSPNNDYLAYVTLSYTAPQTPYVDTVKIINLDTGTDKSIHFSNDKDFIGNLEWTPMGKLLIWELIWEGPWVIFIYDPVIDSTVYVLRLNQNGRLEWNPQGTIFYASHSGEYGRDGCVTEISGFNFEFNNSFPNFYELYDLEKIDDPFGIPYGKNNNLSIEPFAWSADGQSLFIVVTPLTLLENGLYYRQEPKQAGILDFSKQRASFKVLGANPNLNYFFRDEENPALVSESYKPKNCPPIE